jgi:hypothetical protein
MFNSGQLYYKTAETGYRITLFIKQLTLNVNNL